MHILLLSLLQFIQKNSPIPTRKEVVSVLIVPMQEKSTREEKEKTEPQKIGKMPSLKREQQPKKLSSVPEGIPEGSSSKKEEVTKEKDNKIANRILSEKIKPLEDTKKPDVFDREVLAKLLKDKKEKEQINSSQGLTFSTKEFNDWGYLQRLKEKIERVWQYPPEAAEKGIFGDLYIRFIIDKKGRLQSIELIRTSGYKMLDDAAIRALKEAQPFWPLPDDWQKETLTITGHFIYTLRGFYLR